MLGAAPAPADETAPLNPIEIVSWRPAHETRVLDLASGGVRAVVVRPGILYGGSRGIVGDLLQDAANSLVRIVGSGDNHWPLIYDRDLGELYARIAATPAAAGVFHANDEGDETVNDIVAALASMRTPSRASATCRCRRRARRWGPTRTRWPSISWCAARAPARWDGAHAAFGRRQRAASVRGVAARQGGLRGAGRRSAARHPGSL